MPKQPITGLSLGKAKTHIEIYNDKDDESGGGAREKHPMIAGNSEGSKSVKAAPPLRSGNLVLSPLLATALSPGQPQPEVIIISSSSDDNKEEFVGFHVESPPRKVLLTKGSGHRKRHVKEEPFSASGSRARSAWGRSSVLGDHASGRSTAKGKRKRVWRKAEMKEEAGSSREKNNEKNIGAGRGSEVDQSPLAKEDLMSSKQSWGASGKEGCDMESDERSSGSPSVNLDDVKIWSHAHQRGRMQQASHSPCQVLDDNKDDGVAEEQHGRVRNPSYSAWVMDEGGEEEQRRVVFDDFNIDAEADEEQHQVVFDDFNSDSDEAQQEREREEMVEEVAVEVDGKGSEGDSEGEQEEYLVGENEESDNGDSHGQEAQAAAAAADDYDVEEQQEMEWNNELEEEESGSEEGRYSNYEADDEESGEDDRDGEEESGEDDEEFHGAGEVHSSASSNTIAAGSARSEGDSTKIFKNKIFEEIYFSKIPDNTAGEGIASRTRSKRKCSDMKLLKRGFFSKPIKIDIDSTSESEEEILPQEPMVQGLHSSSEYYSNETRQKSSSKIKNRRRKRKASTSPDKHEVVRKYRRLKKGPSNGQVAMNDSKQNVQAFKNVSHKNVHAAKEGGKTHNDLKHSGPNGERPMNNAQDDLSFKQHANLAKMRKHQASKEKAAYDELLDAMFAEWENYTKASIPADRQNSITMPLTFSFGDEDGKDKSDDEESQKELWGEYDAAIESINVEEDDNCGRQKVPPEEAPSCENGRHKFIIDERIGVRCEHCNVVDLEIRYVLPSMGKFTTERDSTSPRLDLFKEMVTFFEENDLFIPNRPEGTSRIGARKAGSVWDLIPGVKEGMFLHQQDAFEFMWRKLAGSTKIEEIEERRCTKNTDIGGGCVISHAPGTGKTRLAITFVQSYLEVFPQCCPVIIAPRAMLATWEQEFKKWKVELPFHVLNSTEINCNDDKTIQEKIEKDGSFARRLLANKMDQNYRRLVKLASWVNGTSIIGVSYSLFRKLANDDGMDGDNVRKLLLERPDLLVLDEGHTPRNKTSLIWKVLSRVRTEKRIILSGTLFQNNFEELHNTLYLVRPKDAMLLEKDGGKDWTSFRLSNITEENIDNVRAKLESIVHYHKGNFLENSLPGLKETVVILNPLPRQKEIMTSIEKTASMGSLDAEYKISLALVHPSLITCAKLSEQEACLVDHTLLESIRSNPCEGVKTRFVVEAIHQCQALNERVLVFSQYLEPLSLIMDQLKRQFNWTEDKEILHMSGNVQVKQREAMMEAFNNMKSEAKVMLASTKACCEGITLVGASRVVLVDVVWNPSVGRQAIGRAYRFGQKKIVYTYNLIAAGTKEMEKYSRQAKKEHMSKRLFSNEEEPEGGNISPESTFNDRILEAMIAREDLKDLFVQIRIENQTDGSTMDVLETEQENENPII